MQNSWLILGSSTRVSSLPAFLESLHPWFQVLKLLYLFIHSLQLLKHLLA